MNINNIVDCFLEFSLFGSSGSSSMTAPVNNTFKNPVNTGTPGVRSSVSTPSTNITKFRDNAVTNMVNKFRSSPTSGGSSVMGKVDAPYKPGKDFFGNTEFIKGW